jgi:hypothetical protein
MMLDYLAEKLGADSESYAQLKKELLNFQGLDW